MTKVNTLKKEDEFKDLGNKIVRFVEYHKRKDRYAPVIQLAALADVLCSVKEILRSYDERFKKLEESLKDKNKEGVMINR